MTPQEQQYFANLFNAQKQANPNLDLATAVQMGNLLHKLSRGKNRRAQLGLIQSEEPGYRMPSDVAVADLEQKMRKEREDEKKKDQEERAKSRRARDRAALVSELGEDVVKQIDEGPLKKYPHLDYKDAAVLLRGENSPVSPSGRPPDRFRHGQIWEFPDLPGLLNDPAKSA